MGIGSPQSCFIRVALVSLCFGYSVFLQGAGFFDVTHLCSKVLRRIGLVARAGDGRQVAPTLLEIRPKRQFHEGREEGSAWKEFWIRKYSLDPKHLDTLNASVFAERFVTLLIVKAITPKKFLRDVAEDRPKLKSTIEKLLNEVKRRKIALKWSASNDSDVSDEGSLIRLGISAFGNEFSEEQLLVILHHELSHQSVDHNLAYADESLKSYSSRVVSRFAQDEIRATRASQKLALELQEKQIAPFEATAGIGAKALLKVTEGDSRREERALGGVGEYKKRWKKMARDHWVAHHFIQEWDSKKNKKNKTSIVRNLKYIPPERYDRMVDLLEQNGYANPSVEFIIELEYALKRIQDSDNYSLSYVLAERQTLIARTELAKLAIRWAAKDEYDRRKRQGRWEPQDERRYRDWFKHLRNR